jgi:NTE family protein
MAFGGCAHVTNAPLCSRGSAAVGCGYDPSAQTSYRFSPRSDRDTLIVVTLSGGGTRAAALALGTLEILGGLDGTDGGKLLDKVDIISSVSGGSVTAGWYALNGREGLPKNGLTEAGNDGTYGEFLKSKWTLHLAWDALNPISLLRYAFTSYERSDVLSGFLASHLYGKATYTDVLSRYKNPDAPQPYVILNATDLGHEAIFPFTQGRFDFLCSNLLQYRVADAVAASANFPLAFSATGLQNFSGCDAQKSPSWGKDGPPQWVEHYNELDKRETPHAYELTQLRAARQSDDYLQLVSPEAVPSEPVDKYVHLLDGGVADNLGIRSTLALEDDPARVPGLYLRLGPANRPEGYQRITRVLYVVVNARNRDPGLIDSSRGPPGEISTAFRMADTLLDTSTLADQDFVISELEATANRNTQQPNQVGSASGGGSCRYQGKPSDSPPFLSSKPAAQASYAAPACGLRFDVVAVDFEMIPDKTCRDAFWSLGTNWGLAKSQVVALDEIAKAILTHSVDLEDYYADSAGSDLLRKQSTQTLMSQRDAHGFKGPCAKVSSK